jgi:sortase A
MTTSALKRRWPLLAGLFLLCAGIGLVGLVIWQNFLPDAAAEQAAAVAAADLHHEWAADTASSDTGTPSLQDNPMNRPIGKGFAILYIPRLGDRWRSVVVEGVQDADLLGKVGHFKASAEPGMIGNFALAAHRLTKGSLFRYLDEVKPGDFVIVETRTHWYVYTITGSDIISPTDIAVTLPVPFKPGKTPTRAIITLTTCHPWYSSTSRLAVSGVLTETRLKSMGPPAALPAEAVTTP